MHATISRWGNSLAVRLPKHIADQVRLVEGSTVQLEIDDGTLKIIPARKKFKLSELLAGEPERTSEQECAEVDWGKPEGDEVW
ncbi:MAG: AbrB/MazE/SpoVT family DNA-binding domain-containing protein [Hyphomicrobiaceae bacterium]